MLTNFFGFSSASLTFVTIFCVNILRYKIWFDILIRYNQRHHLIFFFKYVYLWSLSSSNNPHIFKNILLFLSVFVIYLFFSLVFNCFYLFIFLDLHLSLSVFQLLFQVVEKKIYLVLLFFNQNQTWTKNLYFFTCIHIYLICLTIGLIFLELHHEYNIVDFRL